MQHFNTAFNTKTLFLNILEKKILPVLFWRFSCKRKQNGLWIRIQVSSLLLNTLILVVRKTQLSVAKD